MFLGSLALTVLLASGGQATISTAKPVRTVQLIRLKGMSPASLTDAAADDIPRIEGVNEAVSLTAPVSGETAFRVHDLGRRWVEFDMRNNFQALRPYVALANIENDPFARVGVDQIDPSRPSTTPAPPGSIAIPAWMRGGLAFSGAAMSYVPRCAANGYRPAGFLSAAAESRRFGFYALMNSIACQYGIPTGLFDAMIIRESGYQPAIYSPKNAYGLTQLMPGTAVDLGVNRYDTAQNLRGGAKYLRQQLDRFGQVHLALAAYNAGPSHVRNGMLPQIGETEAYVANVLLNWRRLAGLTPTIVPPKRLLGKTSKLATARSVSISAY